jgi:hypothetical protein
MKNDDEESDRCFAYAILERAEEMKESRELI